MFYCPMIVSNDESSDSTINYTLFISSHKSIIKIIYREQSLRILINILKTGTKRIIFIQLLDRLHLLYPRFVALLESEHNFCKCSINVNLNM